jgi:peptidoglycan/LPS O-acetylase OafA/YrhL
MWKHQLGTYHLWSLAMEEQFYFCWPFLCIIALKLKRPWMLPLAIFVLSIIPRLASVPEPYASVMSYPPIGIVVGCTVALLFYFGRDGRGFRVIISPSARNLAAITCVACLAILGYRTQMWGDNATRPWADRWLIPIYAWPFAILIAGFWYGQPIALGRVLSFKPLTYIGRISYGMYLYHMCLNYFVRNILIWIGDEMGIHIRFAFYVASYILFVMAVASASYYLIEKPLLKIGARFRGPATPAKVASRREVDEPLSVSLALNAEAN